MCHLTSVTGIEWRSLTWCVSWEVSQALIEPASPNVAFDKCHSHRVKKLAKCHKVSKSHLMWQWKSVTNTEWAGLIWYGSGKVSLALSEGTQLFWQVIHGAWLTLGVSSMVIISSGRCCRVCKCSWCTGLLLLIYIIAYNCSYNSNKICLPCNKVCTIYRYTHMYK